MRIRYDLITPMKHRTKQIKNRPGGFVRKTVTIPADLAGFVEQQKNFPEHAGNLSSYLRTLILRDRTKATTN
jgi:hypothetical protein